jgi:Flp pilus assembly pilin Flp
VSQLRRARGPAAPETCAHGGPLPDRPRLPSPPQGGQGLVEYGLILMIMAVVCVVSLLFFGDQLSFVLSLIGSAV